MEKYPVYRGCESEVLNQLEKCFLEKVSTDFYKEFIKPEGATEDQSKFYVVFVASKTGTFEVIHVSSTCTRINNEVERVFEKLPAFEPATFDEHAIDKQFILYYPESIIPIIPSQNIQDVISIKDSESPTLKVANSQLRIPFSYSNYNTLHGFMPNQNHTGVRPYIYQSDLDIDAFEAQRESLMKDKTGWWGRKFWNENMVEISGENYWLHLDPLVDLQLGKDNSDFNYTYLNTRAARIEGNLYGKVSFSSTIYESQGRFATYFNRFATYIRPSTDGEAIVPGQGIAKNFGDSAFDFPVATGYVSYSPNKTFNFQFGRDKNFIGEGYRSMFLSDAATNSTYFKIQTRFWKIQYTNLWLWLRNVNIIPSETGVYQRKFAAMHHLSWNATPKLNIGLFESVIWAKTPDQGFDVDYLNPIILFRPIEFSMGSKKGNALIGMNASYKFTQDISLYSQILFDEITIKEMTGSKGYWANKYAFQLGGKYFNAFQIPNLTLQAEYNMARPYTYSHNNPETNYGHYNQSLAHPWGSNFREGIFIAEYQKNRWFGMAKAVMGIKGFDYNTLTDSYSYGGDIYRDYSDRNADYGVETGQGNKANILIGEIQAGYLINPATNLKLFGGLLFRNFEAQVVTDVFENGKTTWFTFGLRSDLNNWYFDF
ncbi:MAG: gliding motility protein RemB [Flavobacteriaceae bacterium]|nr:gliding motility protein RemB [Flavobacteriaceae bacterium]